MEEKQPQDPRPSSANFLNVLGVALSGLAILAVLFSLYMTQISLNEISLALDSIEDKLEVNSEDIESIQETDEEEVDEEASEDQDENSTQTITLLQGFTMDIPSDWEVVNMTQEEIVFMTAEEPYEITETVDIDELDEISDSYNIVSETSVASIYQIGCAPAMGCYAVEIDDEIYSMDWNMIESTEPEPENLDGVWFPDVNFDQDDIETILKSIKPAAK